jgi:para-nitrobenzyl esterase
MGKLDDFINSLPKNVVETLQGPVEGYVLNGVVYYKGIPYAASPEGALRWKPPQPREAWREPFKASRAGFICPQDAFQFPIIGQVGEDCLNLNIWSPEKIDKPCPVMVWLHGGGFSAGSGSMPIYDGSHFASLGIVTVTVNYRLNALGFLAHPELTAESARHASGNYGIMDQVFALQWVRDNIRGFGGDPGKVTIFGESAGGASVATLLSTPLSSGLFHRAIAQSPGNLPRRLRKLDQSGGGLQSAEAIGLRFADKLGLEGSKGVIERMRSIHSSELAEAWFRMVHEDIDGVGSSGTWMMNQLIVDGHVLPESPGETFNRGRQHNMPFMTGVTADEGTLFSYMVFGKKPDPARYRGYIERVYGKSKEKVIAHLGGAGSADGIREAAAEILGSGFYSGARRLARGMSGVQPRTYRYLFSLPPGFFLYQIPGIDDWKGRFRCFHAGEIPYVFHFVNLPGLEEHDRALAARMAGYWARFAATGDPNGQGDPSWPRCAAGNEQYLVLDNPIVPGKGYRDRLCDLIDEIEE